MTLSDVANVDLVIGPQKYLDRFRSTVRLVITSKETEQATVHLNAKVFAEDDINLLMQVLKGDSAEITTGAGRAGRGTTFNNQITSKSADIKAVEV